MWYISIILESILMMKRRVDWIMIIHYLNQDISDSTLHFSEIWSLKFPDLTIASLCFLSTTICLDQQRKKLLSTRNASTGRWWFLSVWISPRPGGSSTQLIFSKSSLCVRVWLTVSLCFERRLAWRYWYWFKPQPCSKVGGDSKFGWYLYTIMGIKKEPPELYDKNIELAEQSPAIFSETMVFDWFPKIDTFPSWCWKVCSVIFLWQLIHLASKADQIVGWTTLQLRWLRSITSPC